MVRYRHQEHTVSIRADASELLEEYMASGLSTRSEFQFALMRVSSSREASENHHQENPVFQFALMRVSSSRRICSALPILCPWFQFALMRVSSSRKISGVAGTVQYMFQFALMRVSSSRKGAPNEHFRSCVSIRADASELLEDTFAGPMRKQRFVSIRADTSELLKALLLDSPPGSSRFQFALMRVSSSRTLVLREGSLLPTFQFALMRVSSSRKEEA